MEDKARKLKGMIKQWGGGERDDVIITA